MKALYICSYLCKYIIKQCNDLGKKITNLQLQKILYYVQGYYLKNYYCLAFSSSIQAWQYGPVVPDAYYDYCTNGKEDLYVDDSEVEIVTIETKEEEKLINSIITKCLSYGIGALIKKTHEEEPWDITIRQGFKKEISIKTISEFFDKNDPLQLYEDKISE